MPASPRPAGGTVYSVHHSTVYVGGAVVNDGYIRGGGPAGGTEPRAGGSDLKEVYKCHSVNSHLKRELSISVNSHSHLKREL